MLNKKGLVPGGRYVFEILTIVSVLILIFATPDTGKYEIYKIVFGVISIILIIFFFLFYGQKAYNPKILQDTISKVNNVTS